MPPPNALATPAPFVPSADQRHPEYQKLKGRILNRERINKTIEGVYFICIDCKKVCHNMDDGLVEDPNNVQNMCGACAKTKGKDGKGKPVAA